MCEARTGHESVSSGETSCRARGKTTDEFAFSAACDAAPLALIAPLPLAAGRSRGATTGASAAPSAFGGLVAFRRRHPCLLGATHCLLS